MLFYIYLALLALSTFSAVFTRQYSSTFKWFRLALVLLLVSELIIALLRKSIPFIGPLIYQINIPLYLIFIYLFLRDHIQEFIIKQFLLITVVAYCVMCLSLSVFFYTVNDFPGIQLNVMGVIIIGMCLYILLTLDPIGNIPIYKHPMAWICLGYVVFFSATFFLNGIYNHLVETNSPLRSKIHLYINTISNCFMYSCFIVGLYLSNALTKMNKKSS